MLENIIIVMTLLGAVSFVIAVYKVVSYTLDKTWENIERRAEERLVEEEEKIRVGLR